MRFPEFDPQYLAEHHKDTEVDIEQLCYRAQEILCGYALDNFDMSLEEETPGCFKVVSPEQPIGDEEREKDVDLEDVVTEICTEDIYINDNCYVFLDNIPYIKDKYGDLQQLLEPGYVALKFINIVDAGLIEGSRKLEGISDGTTQFIFRLPWHSYGAAIYEGFDLSDENQLDLDVDEFEELSNLLEDIVDIMREGLKSDAVKDQPNYWVQNIPVNPVATIAMQFLMIESRKD